MPDLWTAITSGEPAPITRSAVPDGLQAVVHRCLAKSRDKRYRGAAELARALAPFGSKMAAETAQRAWKITQIAKDASQKRTTKRPALRPRMTAALIGAAALLGLASMQMCGETRSTAARDAPAQGVPVRSAGASAGAVAASFALSASGRARALPRCIGGAR